MSSTLSLPPDRISGSLGLLSLISLLLKSVITAADFAGSLHFSAISLCLFFSLLSCLFSSRLKAFVSSISLSVVDDRDRPPPGTPESSTPFTDLFSSSVSKLNLLCSLLLLLASILEILSSLSSDMTTVQCFLL